MIYKLFHRVIVMGAFFSLLLSASASAFPVFIPSASIQRARVPAQYKWNLGALYRHDGLWNYAAYRVKVGIDKLKWTKGRLSNPETLRKCLKGYFATRLVLDHVSLYAGLKNAQDLKVIRYDKMNQRAVELVRSFQARTSFIKQEVLSLDDDTAARLINNPKLSKYKNYLIDLRRRSSRMLDSESERILSISGDNLWAEIDINEIPSDIEMIFKATMRDLDLPRIQDEEGALVQLKLSNYRKFRASDKRSVRKAAVQGLSSTLKDNENILAATLSGEVKRDVFLARSRKYDRAIDAYLDKEHLDAKIVDNLIKTVNKNLKPLHKYIKLKKKLLGLDKFYVYDLSAPIVKRVKLDFTLSSAIKDVEMSLRPLGENYTASLSKSIKPGSGWTDYYSNMGKQRGAFCAYRYGAHPFVLTNYMDTIGSVFTLAHEYGHAMHSFINMKAMDYVDFGYSSLIAETASTFNEIMLAKYLLKQYKTDDALRTYLLGGRLETIRITLYAQTMLAEFEREIHKLAEEGKPLNAEVFNDIYKELLQKYYGKELIVEDYDNVGWSYIPHFYWKYYVFNYAAGISSAIAFVENIEKDGEEARDKYLNMLKQSRFKSPITILKEAGVDITKPDAIKAATRYMNDAVEEIEKIIK